MKLIKPYFEIEEFGGKAMIQRIEKAGRTCYKSEKKITNDSAEEFVKMIIKRGHESVLEHEKVSVRIICDRGVSHELVRHRIASFSQESTRFCNYSKDKFGNQITFIIPCWLNLDEGIYLMLEDNGVFDTPKGITPFNSLDKDKLIYLSGIQETEIRYNELINLGWQPQQARSVLPNSLKTEIVITANLREWRLIFKQRTAEAAHPQMREMMIPMLKEFKILLPVIFNDINYATHY